MVLRSKLVANLRLSQNLDQFWLFKFKIYFKNSQFCVKIFIFKGQNWSNLDQFWLFKPKILFSGSKFVNKSQFSVQVTFLQVEILVSAQKIIDFDIINQIPKLLEHKIIEIMLIKSIQH